MCIIAAHIIMGLGGLYALIAGKVKLTGKVSLVGWQARIAGLILVGSVALIYAIQMFMGLLVGARVMSLGDATVYASLISIVLTIVGLVGTLIFGAVVARQSAQQSQPPQT